MVSLRKEKQMCERGTGHQRHVSVIIRVVESLCLSVQTMPFKAKRSTAAKLALFMMKMCVGVSALYAA